MILWFLILGPTSILATSPIDGVLGDAAHVKGPELRPKANASSLSAPSSLPPLQPRHHSHSLSTSRITPSNGGNDVTTLLFDGIEHLASLIRQCFSQRRSPLTFSHLTSSISSSSKIDLDHDSQVKEEMDASLMYGIQWLRIKVGIAPSPDKGDCKANLVCKDALAHLLALPANFHVMQSFFDPTAERTDVEEERKLTIRDVLLECLNLYGLRSHVPRAKQTWPWRAVWYFVDAGSRVDMLANQLDLGWRVGTFCARSGHPVLQSQSESLATLAKLTTDVSADLQGVHQCLNRCDVSTAEALARLILGFPVSLATAHVEGKAFDARDVAACLLELFRRPHLFVERTDFSDAQYRHVSSRHTPRLAFDLDSDVPSHYNHRHSHGSRSDRAGHGGHSHHKRPAPYGPTGDGDFVVAQLPVPALSYPFAVNFQARLAETFEPIYLSSDLPFNSVTLVYRVFGLVAAQLLDPNVRLVDIDVLTGHTPTSPTRDSGRTSLSPSPRSPSPSPHAMSATSSSSPSSSSTGSSENSSNGGTPLPRLSPSIVTMSLDWSSNNAVITLLFGHPEYPPSEVLLAWFHASSTSHSIRSQQQLLAVVRALQASPRDLLPFALQVMQGSCARFRADHPTATDIVKSTMDALRERQGKNTAEEKTSKDAKSHIEPREDRSAVEALEPKEEKIKAQAEQQPEEPTQTAGRRSAGGTPQVPIPHQTSDVGNGHRVNNPNQLMGRDLLEHNGALLGLGAPRYNTFSDNGFGVLPLSLTSSSSSSSTSMSTKSAPQLEKSTLSHRPNQGVADGKEGVFSGAVAQPTMSDDQRHAEVTANGALVKDESIVDCGSDYAVTNSSQKRNSSDHPSRQLAALLYGSGDTPSDFMAYRHPPSQHADDDSTATYQPTYVLSSTSPTPARLSLDGYSFPGSNGGGTSFSNHPPPSTNTRGSIPSVVTTTMAPNSGSTTLTQEYAHVFCWRPQGNMSAPIKTIHVAGSWNDWREWTPLRPTGQAGEYTGQVLCLCHDVEYQYKFVVDEHIWLPDPGNVNHKLDGQGNVNSVLRRHAVLFQ